MLFFTLLGSLSIMVSIYVWLDAIDTWKPLIWISETIIAGLFVVDYYSELISKMLCN